MKQFIYISFCLLTATITGCTETTEVGPGAYTEVPSLKLSSEKLIFDIDGGSAAVIVATNLEKWEYTPIGDWFTVTKKGENIIEITTQINTSGRTLEGTLMVSGQHGEQKLEAIVTIAQGAERSLNVSMDGLSNCYVVPTNGAFTLDASIKGNGKGDGRSTYIQKHGLEIKNVAYADLLWEARNDGDRTMGREIIDGSPIYKDGFISFRTGRSQGNAVLCAKDITGTVIWSWHIWVCNDKIESHDHINATKRVIAQIMDRNLGALNNTPMDINNRGMFYQWGRKDPFIPSLSPYVADSDGANNPNWNQTNLDVGNGSGAWIFNATMKPIDTVPGNIPNTTENPMTFLQYYYSEYYDWYCIGTDQNVTDSGLWDDQKTIFDPCPAGYRVPGRDTWGVPGGARTLPTGGRIEEYDLNGENELWDWNVWNDCGRVWKFTKDYYPAAGNIVYISEEKTPYNFASSQAFYWTSHRIPDRITATSYRMDFNMNWGNFWTSAHVFSAQIRCVKE